jgi:hypothetical protein
LKEIRSKEVYRGWVKVCGEELGVGGLEILMSERWNVIKTVRFVIVFISNNLITGI